jgi:hypothetical protein
MHNADVVTPQTMFNDIHSTHHSPGLHSKLPSTALDYPTVMISEMGRPVLYIPEWDDAKKFSTRTRWMVRKYDCIHLGVSYTFSSAGTDHAVAPNLWWQARIAVSSVMRGKPRIRSLERYRCHWPSNPRQVLQMRPDDYIGQRSPYHSHNDVPYSAWHRILET